jgi:hypothetical protein
MNDDLTKNTLKEYFNNRGYCFLKNAISNELRDFVTQYALFDEMQDFKPEGIEFAVPNAHSKYADPVMETMLIHLHPLMEEYTGLKLFPTYSYYRVYRPGDVLKPHIDRPSCEISSTLCFNYNYDDSKYQWPIFMSGNKLNLYPGDMAIYRGCDLEHWRENFNIDEDVWHVQGFFHYVDQNGPNSNFKFDGRKGLGEIPSKTNYKEYITFLN